MNIKEQLDEMRKQDNAQEDQSVSDSVYHEQQKNIGYNQCLAELEPVIQKLVSETEKAFGGCTNCYGKGYSTVIEIARGRGESDMGQGDVEINYQLPPMRFCSCGRGKQLKSILALNQN